MEGTLEGFGFDVFEPSLQGVENLAFGDLLDLRVQLLQFGVVKHQLGDVALIIDRLRRLIRHGALDVVDANRPPLEEPTQRALR